MTDITDPNGTAIHPGSFARVLTIPDWLTHDLPLEDVIRLKKTQGTVMRIIEIDKFGYVWLGADELSAGWFSLKPTEIEVVEPT